MALINTDWENELDQVERKVINVLDDKVEPLFDRTVAKASAEASTIVSQAAFELQEVTNNLLREIRNERQEAVKEIRALIRYAALLTFVVVTASTIVITIAQNY